MWRAVVVLALGALAACGSSNGAFGAGDAGRRDAAVFDAAAGGGPNAPASSAGRAGSQADGGARSAADGGGPGWPWINRHGPVQCGAVAACPDPGLQIPLEYIPPAMFVPWPCCADASQSRCGFDRGDGCVPTPADAPSCPSVIMPLTGPTSACCTTDGDCGVDLSRLAEPQYACYDLRLLPTLDLVANPPAPRRCDGTALDEDAGVMSELDAGAP